MGAFALYLHYLKPESQKYSRFFWLCGHDYATGNFHLRFSRASRQVIRPNRNEFRNFRRASIESKFTARLERTAFRCNSHIDNVATYNFRPPFLTGVRKGHGGKQSMCVWMGRMIKYLGRLAHFHYFSLIDHYYLVRHIVYQNEVMGDEQISQAKAFL